MPTAVEGALAWHAGPVEQATRSPLLAAPTSLEDELLRLDLLLDLFDAARFGPDAAAADALWGALALDPPAHGEGATRRAVASLLDHALRLETRSEGYLDEDAHHFLSSAIQMLNVDANRPQSAEDLELQMLAHRTLLETGHPRLHDNARWRLYDHVRDALSAAVEAPGVERADIGVHALLATQESLLPWLDDGGPHDLAVRPSAAELLDLADSLADALRADARWSTIATRRANEDQERFAALERRWASPPVAPLPLRDAGFGRAESALPRLLLTSAGMAWGGRDAKPHPFGFDDATVVAELRQFIEADGRLGLYVDADEQLPAPDLGAALRASAKAGVKELQLGLAELRLHAEEHPELGDRVYTQMPLRIVMGADHGPETQAFRDSRLALELTGRGAYLWADDELTHADPLSGAALAEALRQLKAAYPKQSAMRLVLHNDLRYPQLIDAMQAALGRADAPPGTHFRAVGWLADAPRPERSQADAQRGAAALEARAYLGQVQWKMEVVQPFPMRPEDQGRADAMAQRAKACWTELALGPKHREALGAIEFSVSMAEGAVIEHDFAFRFRGRVRGPKLDPGAEKRTHECLKEETQRLRLPSHRDAFEMTFRYLVARAPVATKD